MPYPYTDLATNITSADSSALADKHANHHNAIANALNDLRIELGGTTLKARVQALYPPFIVLDADEARPAGIPVGTVIHRRAAAP